jgi:predicted transcriptional regulator
VLNTFYEINDIIRKNQAILLLQINQQLLKEKEFQLLSEEYQSLPSKQIKEIYLDDKLIELLTFIYEQKQSNRNVYQKNICNELSISKVTAQKRIDDLIDKGLIFSKKQGRTKNIHITEKGKEFLKKQN